jgi:hypothetical protein
MGFLIIVGMYCAIGFLLWTFMRAYTHYAYNADFDRRYYNGEAESWREDEYKTFWYQAGAIFWPVTVPILAAFITYYVVILMLLKPLTKSLVKMWTYVIKETMNPRENV